MKRTFRGEVKYEIGRALAWFTDKHNDVTSVTREEFCGIFDTLKVVKGSRGILVITLRLIGGPMPWSEWGWGVGEYQANRLIVENTENAALCFSAYKEDRDGIEFICSVCSIAIEDIFPGLMKAIGSWNACEVEITGEIRGCKRLRPI